MNGHFRRRKPGAAYTLVEMLVGMTASTALLVGLASSTYIARQAFEGQTSTTVRAQAADVQADLLNDLRLATGFTARSATQATFTVPDRNNDGVAETITYAYTGAPSNQLTWSLNGVAPLPLLDNVNAFQLTFLDRSVTSVYPPPGTVDMNSWGNRWITSGTIGYTTVFANLTVVNEHYFLTKATLPVDGTARSITVYLKSTGGAPNSNVRCAVYAASAEGVPLTLKAQSAVISVSGTNWYTFDLPSTTLTAGDYYLAVSYKSSTYSVAYNSTGGTTIAKSGDGTSASGFPAQWPGGGTTYATAFSIYLNYDSLQ